MPLPFRHCAWLALCAPLALTAQVDSVRMHYAATITQADLREYLIVLARDRKSVV